MLTVLFQLIALVPGCLGFAQKLMTAKYDAEVQKFVAATGASRDVAVAALRMQAEVQTKWWFVALVPPALTIPFMVWTWQAVAWDKVISKWFGIMDASTDPLDGVLGTAYMMILGYWFMHGLATKSTL